MQFNQTRYWLSASADDPPGTKLGTIWISMPLSLVSLENGSFSPIEIDHVYLYHNGLHSEYYPVVRTYYLESFDLEFYFSGQQTLVEGYELSTFLNLTQDDVNFCGNEYILIPIDVYTQSEFFAIARFYFHYGFRLHINDEHWYLYAHISVDADPGKYVQYAFVLLILFPTTIIVSFIVQIHIIPPLLQGRKGEFLSGWGIK